MSNQSESLESVVIGDGVVVKGTFIVPSKAIVNGVIEGDLSAEEVLIGPTGRITGRVAAKVIDVRGQDLEELTNRHAKQFHVSPFMKMDMIASSTWTRQNLDWTPTGPSLIADLKAMDYAAASSTV